MEEVELHGQSPWVMQDSPQVVVEGQSPRHNTACHRASDMAHVGVTIGTNERSCCHGFKKRHEAKETDKGTEQCRHRACGPKDQGRPWRPRRPAQSNQRGERRNEVEGQEQHGFWLVQQSWSCDKQDQADKWDGCRDRHHANWEPRCLITYIEPVQDRDSCNQLHKMGRRPPREKLYMHPPSRHQWRLSVTWRFRPLMLA
ncbi:MAG: hypothetical protein AB7K24_05275 [Gemmataceae bacterium]